MADTASTSPVVSVIIPHYLGDILSDCLKTIYEAEEPTPFEVGPKWDHVGFKNGCKRLFFDSNGKASFIVVSRRSGDR